MVYLIPNVISCVSACLSCLFIVCHFGQLENVDFILCPLSYGRYLKRGINEKGRAANEVETEQIVFEEIPGGYASEISSVVQIRGSIPLFWSQETSRLNLRPDIICMSKFAAFGSISFYMIIVTNVLNVNSVKGGS